MEAPSPDFEEKVKDFSTASRESTGTAMNEQMEKAFEIVDTIEQIHPLPGAAASGQPSIPQAHDGKNPETVRLQLSLSTPETKDEATMPVISFNLKIPSFFWRIPVISGVTRNIIRKFTKA